MHYLFSKPSVHFSITVEEANAGQATTSVNRILLTLGKKYQFEEAEAVEVGFKMVILDECVGMFKQAIGTELLKQVIQHIIVLDDMYTTFVFKKGTNEKQIRELWDAKYTNKEKSIQISQGDGEQYHVPSISRNRRPEDTVQDWFTETKRSNSHMYMKKRA